MSDKLTQTVQVVQATAGTVTVGAGLKTFVEQNATLITLGFTACTFLVFLISTVIKLRWEYKARQQ